MLDASYQGVKRLFVLAYRNSGGANRDTADFHRRYFLPRVKIENYNIEINGRKFYDQSEKYQQVKVIITQLLIYWILLI